MIQSLDVMQSRPGIYAIVTFGGVGFVEVIEGGRVYQLRPDTFDRDGELLAGNWNPGAIHAIAGPLARMSTLRAIFSHWNEFGPEHGFGELMDRLQS